MFVQVKFGGICLDWAVEKQRLLQISVQAIRAITFMCILKLLPSQLSMPRSTVWILCSDHRHTRVDSLLQSKSKLLYNFFFFFLDTILSQSHNLTFFNKTIKLFKRLSSRQGKKNIDCMLHRSVNQKLSRWYFRDLPAFIQFHPF